MESFNPQRYGDCSNGMPSQMLGQKTSHLRYQIKALEDMVVILLNTTPKPSVIPNWHNEGSSFPNFFHLVLPFFPNPYLILFPQMGTHASMCNLPLNAHLFLKKCVDFMSIHVLNVHKWCYLEISLTFLMSTFIDSWLYLGHNFWFWNFSSGFRILY